MRLGFPDAAVGVETCGVAYLGTGAEWRQGVDHDGQQDRPEEDGDTQPPAGPRMHAVTLGRRRAGPDRLELTEKEPRERAEHPPCVEGKRERADENEVSGAESGYLQAAPPGGGLRLVHQVRHEAARVEDEELEQEREHAGTEPLDAEAQWLDPQREQERGAEKFRKCLEGVGHQSQRVATASLP